ncbi:MAG TPA: J domain-containing protein [Ktedonobacterales bacterium]|nr:J domain-containing protein [Ktedonobacterales bacterium]
MNDEPDYYALLEVAPDADDATIRATFRRLARRYHPDVAGTGNLEHMRALNVAYQTLSDPEQRSRYDLRHPASVRNSSAHVAPSAAPLTAAVASRSGLVASHAGPFHCARVVETSERLPVGALAMARATQTLAIGMLDGRVLLWDIATDRLIARLGFGSAGAVSAAGVLQELRLSPTGAIAMGWGYQLGTRVWNVATAETLWNTSATAPSGMMDAALFDTPAMVRIAYPQAPLALAGDDPFRWAHEGRYGSSVLSRPLTGPVAAGWAVPLECADVPEEYRADRSDIGPGVQIRALADDGRRLLSCLIERRKSGDLVRAVNIWDLDHRSLRGAAQPRRERKLAQPLEELGFPIAFTPDLAWGVATRHEREMAVFSLREKKGKLVRTGVVSPDSRAALSPDGAYLALAHESSLRLWHVPSGQLAQEWRGAAEIGPVEFANRRGGQLLAVGLASGLIELWTT